MRKPKELSRQAKRFRTIARGYQSLRLSKAAVYQAAAELLERLETQPVEELPPLHEDGPRFH
jgi:hypothetical protein